MYTLSGMAANRRKKKIPSIDTLAFSEEKTPPHTSCSGIRATPASGRTGTASLFPSSSNDKFYQMSINKSDEIIRSLTMTCAR